MSKRIIQPQISTSTKTVTADSFQNLLSAVGLGTANQGSAGRYSINYTSRNRQLLDSVYRSSWIAGKAIDAYAKDMVRKGVEILNLPDPTQITQIHSTWKDLRMWDQVRDVIKWARLYGGAIGVFLIDGQDFSQPLRPETVRRGAFKGIQIMDRYMVNPSMSQLVTEFGPDLGRPMYYDVIGDSMALREAHIHYSRVFRVHGQDLPYWQARTENGWGQSVLERLFDRLVAFDSATEGTAQLVYKAHLRTIKIKGLRNIIAMGGQAYKGLIANIEMIRAFQSNEGLTLLDGEDDFEVQSYSFAGLDNVLLQMGQQLSGGVGMPLTKLFGQSPAGLNSTGESDLANYYDDIHTEQESMMRSPGKRILDLTYRSTFGIEPPADLDFHFTSLWQMSDMDKARIASDTTNAIAAAFTGQMISQQTAMKELKHMSRTTGLFSTLEDDDIKKADPNIAPNDELSLASMAHEKDLNDDPDESEEDEDAPDDIGKGRKAA